MRAFINEVKSTDTMRHNERGDTIIEVLIATAIISLVLVMAYATATRNARASQETREHTQAVKIAERQVELLRKSSMDPSPDLPGTGQCYQAVTNDLGSSCEFTATGSGATYAVSIMHGEYYKVQVTWDTLAGSKANVTMRYIVP